MGLDVSKFRHTADDKDYIKTSFLLVKDGYLEINEAAFTVQYYDDAAKEWKT